MATSVASQFPSSYSVTQKTLILYNNSGASTYNEYFLNNLV